MGAAARRYNRRAMAAGASVVSTRRRLARTVLRVTSPERSGVLWWDITGLAFAGWGFLLYFLVRGAVVTRTAEAMAHAGRIVEAERALGVFVEPAVQQWVLASALLVRALNFVYFWSDFPLIVGIGLVLFWWKRSEYTLLRDALLLSGGIALIVYWTFPVAPPRFLPEWGFVDTMARYSTLSYQAQSMRPFVNPFAAVPSLHAGWALLLTIAAWRAVAHPLGRAAAVGVFWLQAVAVIGTGNHFLFDVLVGLAVAVCGLALAFWLRRIGYPALRRRLAEWARGGQGTPGRPRVPARRLAGQ